jgi:hypothetical protein
MRLTFAVSVPIDASWLQRMELREGRPAAELLGELVRNVECRLSDEVRHMDGLCGRQVSIDSRLVGEVSPAGVN